MTNKAAFFAQYIQYSSSNVVLMISLINQYVDASVDEISTAKGSDVAIWLADFCLSSFESNNQCGELRLSVSQDSFCSRSFPRSIATSLTDIYSAGAGVVPTGNISQKNSSLSTIKIHVDAVVVFTCMQRWAASRSILPKSGLVGGHLLYISAIMCRILSMQKP